MRKIELPAMTTSNKPILGVSACLMGHRVRFDAGHKRQPFITGLVAGHFELRPICPEMELGLGAPRPAIRLQRLAGSDKTSLVDSRGAGCDLSQPMRDYAAQRVEGLGDLTGYIFKKDSPSCGMERVPVIVGPNGQRRRDGVGLFAQAFMQRWPLVPVEEEGRLNDPGLRERFFERLYALQRWRAIAQPERNVHDFIRFHAGHKLLVMARGREYYRELGRLVAGVSHSTLKQTREHYIGRFMQIMALPCSHGRQVNVLQHLMGYFKRELDAADKQELLTLFERYRRREIALITPLTLLRHYQRRMPNAYLAEQHYLQPYPDSLALRSHA
jgi:uncharacterized protein YbgA (DUF1722 family)/uncharacterized protein YbbK (DUF523 family)